jgi:predicted ThiF/HesA family dinucleotide-utilizing enzyme
MAQTTGTSIQEWEGTTDHVVVATGATAALAAGHFSDSGVTATEVEYDNSTKKWPQAIAKFAATYTVAPTAGDTVEVHIYEDVDGTYTIPPVTTVAHQAKYRGSITVEATTSAQVGQCLISLMGIKKCKGIIKNTSAQSIPTGWTLTFEGVGLNVKA